MIKEDLSPAERESMIKEDLSPAERESMIKEDLSPAELEELLLAKISEYGAKVEELQEAGIKEARAKIKYSVEYAKEYLKIKATKKEDGKGRTDKEAEAYATLNTAELELEYEIAKAQRRAIEEAIKNLALEIDALRSIYSFKKVELEKTV